MAADSKETLLRVNRDDAPVLRTHTLEGDQRWRQVGWLGFSGRVYDYPADPGEHEDAGWSPLWVMIDNDLADPDD